MYICEPGTRVLCSMPLLLSWVSRLPGHRRCCNLSLVFLVIMNIDVPVAMSVAVYVDAVVNGVVGVVGVVAVVIGHVECDYAPGFRV